ncbi:hypothetical protein HMSSN139_48130 [Paenibacillus sp. HMSSN-139]|nr:hypothetical protein HMSSN139_48130 [Paenibacillus sp. HMSSN-139]
MNLVETELMITLDADTLLHKLAIKHIVSRMEAAPPDVCAVAGAVLVRNSRHNFWAKLQEWDYFLGIASIKRLQGMFQGTLVAQGAFSLYKTEAVRAVQGWPDAIGEDIVLTWKFLAQRWRVYFEPLAVAFTDVPESFRHLVRQRSRWARGMIEALKMLKPWNHSSVYAKYLTGCNLLMPYLDLVYTFCWLPGLVLRLFRHLLDRWAGYAAGASANVFSELYSVPLSKKGIPFTSSAHPQKPVWLCRLRAAVPNGDEPGFRLWLRAGGAAAQTDLEMKF